MKNFDRKQLLLAGLLVVLVGLLVGMFPLQQLISPSMSTGLTSFEREDTDVYLKLFSEFTNPMQYIGIDSSAFQVLPAEHVRSPFAIPGSPLAQPQQPQKTQSAAAPAQKAAALKLSGILWDPVEPAAIINNKILRVNGVISGLRVTRIESEAVFLRGRGGNVTLKLPKAKNLIE